MTNEQMAVILQDNIKNLEWAEDYHTRKLQETEYQLSLFRKELKELRDMTYTEDMHKILYQARIETQWEVE